MSNANAAMVGREAAWMGGLYSADALAALVTRRGMAAEAAGTAVRDAISLGYVEAASKLAPGKYVASRASLAREFGKGYLEVIDALANDEI